MTRPDPAPVCAYVLDNGMRVVLAEDHRLPLAVVCVWYDVGARDEPPGRTGLAHLVEHMMFQGTPNVEPNELASYVQSAGGETHGDTTHESTFFVDSVPAHHLAPVLWLEADRMAGVERALTEERLENQRAVVMNERLMRYEGRPSALVWERLIGLAHPEGHPYQHMPAGSITDLRSITLADARKFIRRHYPPGNAVLVVAGDFDRRRTMTAIQRFFGRIPSQSVTVAHPDPPATRMQVAVDADFDAGVPYGGLMAVYRLPPAGAPDADAAALAVAILGAHGYGRLRRALGARRLATDVHFGTIALVRGPTLGMLGVTSAVGVSPAEVDQAVEETLKKYAAEGPTDAELSAAQRRHERSVYEQLSTLDGYAVELARGAALFGDPSRAHALACRPFAVTAADVARAAAYYLNPDNRAVLRHEGDR